jgi:serine/threonine-protein kinase
MTTMVGETIGKYRLLAPLGRGGMGTVYRAVDETLDREVAIKVLSPDLANSEIVQRFRSEAIALAKLNHPDIATIYELYRAGDDLLMVMEFVRGETLDQLLARSPQLSLEQSVSIVDRLLNALDHAHRGGVVHRDLKPANVMITDGGGIKIMDFGIARVVGTDHGTKDGFLLGTPSYMSPEQVLGHDVDGRSDLYSIGVMFYRLLAGSLPFTGDTIVAVAQKQVLETAPPVHLFREGLPEWCEPILQRALAKAPAKRFQTAGEFRAELSRAVGHVPGVPAMPAVSPPATAVSPPRPLVTPPPPAPRHDATILLSDRFSARAALFTPAVVAVCLLASGDLHMAAPWMSNMTTSQAGIVGARAFTNATHLPPAVVAPLGTPTLLVKAVAPTEELPAALPTTASEAPLPAAPRETARSGRMATAANLPPVVFDVATIVGNGEEQRERKAQALLANGSLTVIGDDRTVLQTLEYDRLESISYSRGRNPLWKSSSGPIEIARPKGKFGFLKGDRHWITLRTQGTFVVLRVDQREAGKLLDTLEERTGRHVIYILD